MLITSRLSLVESARAFLRVRQIGKLSEARIADAERDVAILWRHCELWEVTAVVCDLAQQIAPSRALRTLDALHLATFALARRKVAGLEMLTADERLRDAVNGL
jgi:predicted nucleic acid-binding protein